MVANLHVIILTFSQDLSKGKLGSLSNPSWLEVPNITLRTGSFLILKIDLRGGKKKKKKEKSKSLLFACFRFPLITPSGKPRSPRGKIPSAQNSVPLLFPLSIFVLLCDITSKTSVIIHAMRDKITQFKYKKVYIIKILNQFKYIVIIYTYFI